MQKISITGVFQLLFAVVLVNLVQNLQLTDYNQPGFATQRQALQSGAQKQLLKTPKVIDKNAYRFNSMIAPKTVDKSAYRFNSMLDPKTVDKSAYRFNSMIDPNRTQES